MDWTEYTGLEDLKKTSLRVVVFKRICQCMYLLLMCSTLAIEHVTISWFGWCYIDFPINWLIFTLFGVLFMFVIVRD